MGSGKVRWVGWILTGLLVLFLGGVSGVPKFIDFPDKEKMLQHLGLSASLMPKLGVLEIVIALLLLVPRLSLLGAILVTGYLGGATFAHVRVGDPWYFPVALGVLVWVALAMRDRRVWLVLTGSPEEEPGGAGRGR